MNKQHLVKGIKYLPNVIVGGLAIKGLNDIFNKTLGVRHEIAEQRKKEQITSNYGVLNDIKNELKRINSTQGVNGITQPVKRQ